MAHVWNESFDTSTAQPLIPKRLRRGDRKETRDGSSERRRFVSEPYSRHELHQRLRQLMNADWVDSSDWADLDD